MWWVCTTEIHEQKPVEKKLKASEEAVQAL
jgi:hypothetical protein